MIKGIRYYMDYLALRKFLKKARLDPSDVMVASFPKSGNTWMRFMLARALYAEARINNDNLIDYFPTVHKSKPEEIAKLKSPRYIKTHKAMFRQYPRCIYLYRDFRAVVVSAWFHAKNKSKYNGSLIQFATSHYMQTFGPWHWHVEEALRQKQNHPDKIILVRYEDLVKSPAEQLNAVLKFCDIKPIISPEEIVNKTSFGNLRQMEQASNPNTDQNNYFFRSGTSDNWKEYLTSADQQRIMNQDTIRVMKQLGYL